MMIYYKNVDFDSLPDFDTVRAKRNNYYVNGDFAVDIEVTSFYHNGEKYAYPYIMMLNVGGIYMYCRYLWELGEIFQRLKRRYWLSDRRRLIMFVHNLAYEFQFFRDICNFTEVFARTPLKPMKAYDSLSNIEFRCSYTVSGLALAKVAENLKTIQLEKLSGDDFDYTKIRHSETPLTEIEMKYCERDVEILHYWINEEIAKNSGKITNIPLTQTGYVRRECREYIGERVNRGLYHSMIKNCTPDKNLFVLLNKAFAGGDTHGNYLHIKTVKQDVYSFDFASSYPAVMVKCKFPRKFTRCDVTTREMFENLITKKACVFKCSFEHIRAKRHHHILSFSKCETIKNQMLDNGRVVKGDYVTTFFTDVDFRDFREFYEYENMRIIEFYYSNYEYLPKPFVEFILELFKNKTTLKGLKGELNEALYMKSKQFINGLYGMCVTNIVNDEIVFSDGWEKKPVDITKALDKYRNSYSSFLLYQWGVWVTSWARHFLRETIAKIEDNSIELDDFIYCDTDSIKMTNYARHEKIIEDYNKQNVIDMQTALRYHGIDENLIFAKTQKGETKTLGIWERDDPFHYEKFKTLGAKRYMYYDGEFHLTVSGLNKKKATPYIVSHGGFDFFKKGMTIPRGYTGKSTHTYIDRPYAFDVVDYMGNVSECTGEHYIHLEEQEYCLNFNHIFEEFLNGYAENGQPYEPDRDELKIRKF